MYIVCGLPGTGKTTLCKKIESELGYTYISDWQIFAENNIEIVDNLQDKIEVSLKHSSLILDYINNIKDKNVVVDLEYSVSPQDFVNYKDIDANHIIFLGFTSVSEDLLYNLFKQNSKNEEIKDDELKNQIKFYKQMSEIYFNQCKELKLQYVDINKSKKEIIDEIFNNIRKQI